MDSSLFFHFFVFTFIFLSIKYLTRSHSLCNALSCSHAQFLSAKGKGNFFPFLILSFFLSFFLYFVLYLFIYLGVQSFIKMSYLFVARSREDVLNAVSEGASVMLEIVIKIHLFIGHVYVVVLK